MKGAGPRSGRWVANHCTNIWTSISSFFGTVWDWTIDNVCCCFLEDSPEPGQHFNTMKVAKIPSIRTAKDAMKQKEMVEKQVDCKGSKVTPENHHKDLPIVTHNVRTVDHATEEVPKPSSGSASHTSHQPSAPPAIPVPQLTSNKQVTKKTSEKTHLVNPAEKHPDPPRIDFVETGSIFGDRKRHASTNLLLLEDGRFKSPGLPLTTKGPDGRTIRMTFRMGFPNMRSLESRASLRVVKSTESVKTVSSNESSKDKSKRSKKSSKSVKSYLSRNSKDFAHDQLEPQETNEKSHDNESDHDEPKNP